MARFLGIKNVLSNRFETDDDGLITGEVQTPIIWGPGQGQGGAGLRRRERRRPVEELLLRRRRRGRRVDVPGRQSAAHQSRRASWPPLRAKRGWPVLRFTSRSGSNPVSQLRTAAGVASMVPIAAGALGLGLLTRNRRTGVNFFTSAFGRVLLTATGVNINVLGQGEPDRQAAGGVHLQPPQPGRPDHRGQAGQRQLHSVGKKELESDPIVGTMGKVMDAAFIDRDNAKAAVEGLKKVEELARKGLSVLIAPEGTRLDTTEVGPFKKGPFRIAMSAGIPIVPIVIRNAEVIAARDSTTFNPGTVDVVVYPPIPVDDWTVENLPDRIAEVRQLYLDTLKDWPHDELPKHRPVRASEEGAGQEGAGQEAPRRRRPPPRRPPAKKAAAKKRRPRRHRPRRRRQGATEGRP